MTGDKPAETSPMGDRRERGVPCLRCRRETWNIKAICNRCLAREGKA